jgi:hypothetical protein
MEKDIEAKARDVNADRGGTCNNEATTLSSSPSASLSACTSHTVRPIGMVPHLR